MPVLYMLCGLPGSGKTTLAKKLERERPALRLSPDEWMRPLYGDQIHLDQKKFNACRDPVENMQWQVAAQVLALGCDVVLENGFWSRKDRDKYRERAKNLGATVKLLFLDVPRNELWSRLQKRNANLPPGTFHIDERQFDLWSWWFEPPTAEELA